MYSLLRNIRFYILTGSLFVSLGIFFSITHTNTTILSLIRMEEIFGFISLIFFYYSLVIGPLRYRFPDIPFGKYLLHARRAVGVSAFYFALLHYGITFFGQLGEFNGLRFLSNMYLFSLGVGALAFLIMGILTITSLDYAVNALGFLRWKALHRATYLAGILLLIHILLLGTHYSDLSGFVSQITFFALACLLILEAPRIDAWLTKKYKSLPVFGLGTTAIITFLFLVYFILVSPIVLLTNNGVSFDIHASHRLLAQQAAQNQIQTTSQSQQIPGLQGDRNLRYSVSWNNPQNVMPGQPVDLTFRVYDAQNGALVSYFKTPYAKPMHLIIVNNELTYFTHIHPVQNGYDFDITTTFPTDGMYHLYLNFQPWNAIEQQVAFTLPVGNPPNTKAVQKPDPQKITKIFDGYEVTMDTLGALSAQEMTFGNQTIRFTIKDATTHKPITTLKPFLASFGHLTMIDEKTYDFLHVHPYNLVAPLPNANGGPTVDFLPIGIYGPIKPGIYRAFAEFSTKIGEDFDTDFTVKVGE